eukprot:gene19694-biopygen22060
MSALFSNTRVRRGAARRGGGGGAARRVPARGAAPAHRRRSRCGAGPRTLRPLWRRTQDLEAAVAPDPGP